MNQDTIKYLNKLKNKISIGVDERLFIGKLGKSMVNPNLGYLDVFFEVCQETGIISKVESDSFFNGDVHESPQVFVYGGYQDFVKDYGKNKFFIFVAKEDKEQAVDLNQKLACIYKTNYKKNEYVQNNIIIDKDCPFIAEISFEEIGFPLHERKIYKIEIEDVSEDYFDTPHFFKINPNEKMILGPLIKYDEVEGIFHGPKLKTSYSFWRGRMLDEYKAFAVNYDEHEDNICEINHNGRVRRFIINLGEFQMGKNGKPRQSDFRQIDLIPDNILVNEFFKSAQKIQGAKLTSKAGFKQVLNNKSMKLDQDRKDRMFELFSSLTEISEDVSATVVEALQKQESEHILKKIVSDSMPEELEKYLEKYKKDENNKFNKIKSDFDEKKEEVERQTLEINNDLKVIKDELSTLKEERKMLELELSEKKEMSNHQVDNKGESLQGTVEELEKAIQEKENENSRLTWQTESLEQKKKKLETLIDELSSQANSSKTDLIRAYLNHEVIEEIRNHSISDKLISENRDSEELNSNYIRKTNKGLSCLGGGKIPDKRKAVLYELNDRLIKMNRYIDAVNLEAIVIAVAQNQFTVFTGRPGSGKTSFAKQLSCALGSYNSTLFVPVSKEWTKPRDLVGYYNPISKQYESGSTDFYPFYIQISSLPLSDQANSFLILDEFNLSQPEYYMSSLLNISNDSERRVRLSEKKSVSIPETNRFICTANTDETVESLSPRMINRCVFIPFNNPLEFDFEAGELTFDTNLEPIINGSDLIKLFQCCNYDIISSSLKDKIKTIMQICMSVDADHGDLIEVSRRKQSQIFSFCKTMSSQGYSESLILDYAMVYFMLPLINGSGDSYEKRLLRLRDESELIGLEMFPDEISHILVKGKSQFDNYCFSMG